jgi:hypothetical protein
MYKTLIVGVALMVFVSAGYYINKVGGPLITDAIAGNRPNYDTPPIDQDAIPGMYVCDSLSGCANKYVLLLKSDQTAEMIFLQSTEEIQSSIGDINKKNTSPLQEQVMILKKEENSLDSSSTSTQTQEVSPSSTELVPVVTTSNEPLFDEGEQKTENKNTSTLDIVNDNSLTNVEKGEWSIGVQNMLVVTFNEYGTTTYTVPQKFVIKDISTTTLSEISYTKSNYKDMVNPIFLKQQ